MTRERGRNKACEHKTLTNSEERIPRKLENETDERWDQEVREYTGEKREYGVCFSYYCV